MLNIKKEEKIKTVDDQGPNNIGNVETYCSLTQAEYDELSETEKNNGIVYYITDSDTHLTTASTIYYDNSNSHISSTSVQGALDTLDTMLGAIGDGELTELETIIDNAQIALDNVQPIIPTSSGTTGQVLTKTSTGADWGDINALPAGGTVGQVLTKVSSSIGDATWQTPSGGTVDAVNGISPDNNKNVQIDVELTQSQYNALPATKNSDNINYYITDGIAGESSIDLGADAIVYDNTDSNLVATNVQDAIDENVSAIAELSAGLIQSAKIVQGTREWVASFSVTLERGIYLFFGGTNDMKTVEVYSDGNLTITNISGSNWNISGSNFTLSGTATSSRWYFIIQLT